MCESCGASQTYKFFRKGRKAAAAELCEECASQMAVYDDEKATWTLRNWEDRGHDLVCNL